MDDKFAQAQKMFEGFSLDEQIEIIEENIKLRGGDLPWASALLEDLKNEKAILEKSK